MASKKIHEKSANKSCRLLTGISMGGRNRESAFKGSTTGGIGKK